MDGDVRAHDGQGPAPAVQRRPAAQRRPGRRRPRRAHHVARCKDDVPVQHLGDNPDEKLRAQNGVPREQWQDGDFLSPHIRVTPPGAIYVMDWNFLGRVSKLEPVVAAAGRSREGSAQRHGAAVGPAASLRRAAAVSFEVEPCSPVTQRSLPQRRTTDPARSRHLTAPPKRGTPRPHPLQQTRCAAGWRGRGAAAPARRAASLCRRRAPRRCRVPARRRSAARAAGRGWR
jgi:hypothetical protein